jgi:hypothetical protein
VRGNKDFLAGLVFLAFGATARDAGTDTLELSGSEA